jgi:methyl-accepting chemotaxis protein
MLGIVVSFWLPGNVQRQVGGEPAEIAAIAREVAAGNLNIKLRRGKTSGIFAALLDMVRVLNEIVTDIKRVAEDVTDGRTDARGDADAFDGGWRELVVSTNNVVDALMAPFNVATEYIDRIAKGDIPEKITDEYDGDFNEIKNNLNQCITAVNGLTAEAGRLTEAAVAGRLDTRGDTVKFQGEFARIVQGVNDTLDAVIGPLNISAEYVDRIAKGDIPDTITESYNGDFNEIKNNLNTLIGTLNVFLEEMAAMSRAQNAGDIDAKIDVERFSGMYRQMA